MGGRGASSGISDKGKKYGTEYKTLLKASNIKFLKYKDSKSSKTPMETMTKGRVYVTVNNKNQLVAISYYDNNGKRTKQIDLTHYHKKIRGNHTHSGYEHDENGTRRATTEEKKIIEYVNKIWYDKNKK